MALQGVRHQRRAADRPRMGHRTHDYAGHQGVSSRVQQPEQGTGAAAPELPDIGMFASTDIVAVEQACVDTIYNFGDARKNSLIERIESRQGLRQLTAMAEHRMGTTHYDIVEID